MQDSDDDMSLFGSEELSEDEFGETLQSADRERECNY
jgi:hypothetical protein